MKKCLLRYEMSRSVANTNRPLSKWESIEHQTCCSVRGLVAEANFRLVRYGLPKVDITVATNGDKRTVAAMAFQPDKQLEELRIMQVCQHPNQSQL